MGDDVLRTLERELDLGGGAVPRDSFVVMGVWRMNSNVDENTARILRVVRREGNSLRRNYCGQRTEGPGLKCLRESAVGPVQQRS